MRRAPVVLGATAVGLVGVLAFHTPPSTLAVGGVKPATLRGPTTSAGASPPTTSPPTSTTSPPTTAGHAATSAPATTTPPTTAATRSATGEQVSYGYGVLSVAVTVTGSRITSVRIASLDDGANPRSASIDQQSIPILEQQALSAQSASIDGVSGATYTSQGFAQSLQSALTKLGR